MTTLNTWYANNLANYAEQLTSGTGFCGDREMESAYTWSATPSSNIYYAAYGRLSGNTSSVTPTFDCSNRSDLYTTSGAGIGNGALQYPIGLIVADEVAFAGGAEINNYRYYLYTGQAYWTMSPFFYTSSQAAVFIVQSNGLIFYWNVLATLGIRPVINLRADVSLSGTGTTSDPYVVEGA